MKIDNTNRRKFIGSLSVLGCSLYSTSSLSTLNWNKSDNKFDKKNTFPVGLNIPASGFFQQEAYDYSLGVALAAELINTNKSGQFTDQFNGLKSQGILNKKVILHIEDSSCISARAEFNAEKLITEQKVKLLMGSSSSEESLSNRKIASKHSVVYLPNIDHSNICTSKEFSGSSIFFDNSISAKLISKEIGHHNIKESLNVLHIFSDYSWSTNQKASFSKALSSRYLKIDQSEIEFNAKNIIKKINENVSRNQPDYLIVNLYGTQLVDFLNQIKNLNPEAKKVKKVVPLLTHNIIKQINLTEIGDVIYTHFTPNTSSAKDFSNKFEALFLPTFTNDVFLYPLSVENNSVELLAR